MQQHHGMKVRDEFGAWTLRRDSDGIWSAVQRDCEILLLDRSDWRRFGLEPVL